MLASLIQPVKCGRCVFLKPTIPGILNVENYKLHLIYCPWPEAQQMARPSEEKCPDLCFSVSLLDLHALSSQGPWLNVNTEEEALS